MDETDRSYDDAADSPTHSDAGMPAGGYGSAGSADETSLESAFDVDFQDGLPASVDRAAVRRMRLVARILDDSIPVPGTNYRIGVDPIVGVVPGAGDVVTAGLSMYIVAESARLGVSPPTLMKMIANVSIDVAGGSVPFVGGLFDAAWKANKRNVELFVRDVREREAISPEEVTEIEIEIEDE